MKKKENEIFGVSFEEFWISLISLYHIAVLVFRYSVVIR